jgi:phage-related protein
LNALRREFGNSINVSDTYQQDQAATALASGANLKYFHCVPTSEIDGSIDYVPKRILKCYMLLQRGNQIEKFVWEDHYKVNRISVDCRTWSIASTFKGVRKGATDPVTVACDEDESLKVMLRDITGALFLQAYPESNSTSKWAEKMNRFGM